MIHTIEVAPHITLRCFSDDRFKQEGLSLTLVRPMCREEASLNALLPAVLLPYQEREKLDDATMVRALYIEQLIALA